MIGRSLADASIDISTNSRPTIARSRYSPSAGCWYAALAGPAQRGGHSCRPSELRYGRCEDGMLYADEVEWFRERLARTLRPAAFPARRGAVGVIGPIFMLLFMACSTGNSSSTVPPSTDA